MSIITSKEESKKRIAELVNWFRENKDQYQKSTYKEAQARKDFIDKLFLALGWDVDNEQKHAEQYREVINEDSIKVSGKTKAPDYSFRLGGSRVFFVEAKKPFIKVKDSSEASFQLRRYAWNVKIPISILTDFEEFAVYDCRFKPKLSDNSSVGRIQYFTFDEYLDNFDYLWDTFSKEAAWKGSFDKYVESSKGKKGTSEVNSEFLKEIEKWRENLAKNIAIRNKTLTVAELNYSVQKIIDRILFLRIAEDRNIEKYGKLKEITAKSEAYQELLKYSKYADEKYDSGIFDFVKDKLTPALNVDDKILSEIINNLYYPSSPYDFSVLSIELIGSVYEQFLGKTIRLTKSHKAKIEEKPEVKKAGGVYYTPEYVVDYIIKNTVGELIKNKTPQQIKKLKILDPACGSGTFLVRAYAYLLDYHLKFYLKDKQKHRKKIYKYRENQWFLTSEIKKEILLNNIYGVDIDPQAVEISKLSLLLKALENETKEVVEKQMKLIEERVLPNLENNIKCGNSIVDASYFEQKTLNEDSENIIKINPFEWDDPEHGFGDIINSGGFDAIIGNPPYVKEDVNKKIFEQIKKTNLKKYYQGKMDFWYFFTCKSLDILKDDGLHSFIAQNNWVTSDGASILREKILSESKILSFFDFADYKVFKNAGIQTMIFVIQKGIANKSYSIHYCKLTNKKISKERLSAHLRQETKNKDIDCYKAKINPKKTDKTISFLPLKVSDLITYLDKKSNFKLKQEEIGNGIDVLQDFINEKHLQKIKNANIKKGDGIFVLSQKEKESMKFNKYEINKLKPYYTSKELQKYCRSMENTYWIIYADKDVRSDISKYPNFKKHIDKFKPILTSVFKPYGLHRPREQQFFEGEKILSLRKTKEVSFTYTKFPCYVSRAFLVIKPKNVNIKYLSGLLNSKLINFWLYHEGKKQGEQLQIDKQPLLNLPLLLPDSKKQLEVSTIIDSITETIEKKKKCKLDSEKSIFHTKLRSLEKQIDKIIYSIYDLSDDQINIIKNLSY